MLQEALKLAKAGEEESDADLFEELRIPSVSALPQHREDVRRNARWLADRMERLGFKTSLTDVAGGPHPALQAGPGAEPTTPTPPDDRPSPRQPGGPAWPLGAPPLRPPRPGGRRL